MFDYLHLEPKRFETYCMVAGGINAFDMDHPKGRALLQGWFGKLILKALSVIVLDCGIVLNCIGPAGSSRENHRQDQGGEMKQVLIHSL
jgi:hypothetical protein